MYVSPNGFYLQTKNEKLECIYDIKSLIEKIRKKTVDIVILKENIYIETIIIKNKNIEEIVKQYIVDRFGDKDEILYNYIAWKGKLTLYLINTSCLGPLKDFTAMFKIKSIWPIQLKLCKNLKRRYKDFHMFIEEKNYIYFISVKNRTMINNKLVESSALKNTIEEFYDEGINTVLLYGGEELKASLEKLDSYKKVLKLGEKVI